MSAGVELSELNVELMDKRSVYRTPVLVAIVCAITIGIEAVGLKANLSLLVGASVYVLRFALPLLAAYFLSGCRCGDGPFFMTTGGFLGAVGALVGAGLGLMLQGMILTGTKFDDALVAYVVSMVPYLVFATIGSFAATYRWHGRDLEIVWGDEYGSEVGRTATEKLLARAAPPPKKRPKSAKKGSGK